MLKDKNILLIISGGISAYKSLELIRELRKRHATVRCILTKGGSQFVTPMSVSALSEHEVYTDLFSLKDETEMGHIQLSREADLIVVAPASANTIAKMAHGMAEDLASTCLLASNKPVMIVPAMNQMMWSNPATQENIKTLFERGIKQIGPVSGDMACGETGLGRMVEATEIMTAIEQFFHKDLPLSGLKAVVTSGPTYEAIDPVRFIGNRSSGKQGHAIAQELINQGAQVTYVTGPTNLTPPIGANTISIESASEMLDSVEGAIPADIFVSVAAVCDWGVEDQEGQKIKKQSGKDAPSFKLKENPDILKTISNHSNRPKLVIGFAAETESLNKNAKDKLKRKNCDWLVGNNVSSEQNIFGNDDNEVCLFQYTNDRQSILEDNWPRITKIQVAKKLTEEIVTHFKNTKKGKHNESEHKSYNTAK